MRGIKTDKKCSQLTSKLLLLGNYFKNNKQVCITQGSVQYD
jgi:hypothetical protein